MTFSAIEQQRDPRLEGNVSAMLRKIGQQQQRARVEVDREENEGSVRSTVEAGGERCAGAAARQRAGERRRIAARLGFGHA